MISYGILWIVAVITFVVIECFSYQLMSIWMAAGALAALIAFWLGANFTVQFIIFAVVSILLIGLTRPFVKRFVNVKTEKTNTDGLVGKKAIVISEISNLENKGRIKISGMEWSAKADDDTKIADGETVEIIKIEGVKAIVRRGE